MHSRTSFSHRTRRVLPLLVLGSRLAASSGQTIAAPSDHRPGPPKDLPGFGSSRDIQTVITDLAEDTKPSVVSIFPIQAAGRSRDGSGDRTRARPDRSSARRPTQAKVTANRGHQRG
ncbi:MAG: hypothetical protein U0361_00830 [Nitrospiraceae bacterium]